MAPQSRGEEHDWLRAGLERMQDERRYRQARGKRGSFAGWTDGRLNWEIGCAQGRIKQLERGITEEYAEEEREARVARQITLRLPGKFVIWTLKRHGYFNERIMSYLTGEGLHGLVPYGEQESDGSAVIEAVKRIGLVEGRDGKLSLTPKGKRLAGTLPEPEPGLGQLVAMPECRSGFNLVNPLDWNILIQIRERQHTVDDLPQPYMKWHVKEDPDNLLRAGLVEEATGGTLQLTQKGEKFLVPNIRPTGRAGGEGHVREVQEMARYLQCNGHRFHTQVSFGYGPDVVATPQVDGRFDGTQQIACEHESDPTNHADNTRNNYFRNAGYGLPTLEWAWTEDEKEALVSAILKLGDPGVLEKTAARSTELSGEQKGRAAALIRERPPRLAISGSEFGDVVDRLLESARASLPTDFAVYVRRPDEPLTEDQWKRWCDGMVGHGSLLSVMQKKGHCYLVRRVGKRSDYEGEIPLWLANWLVAKHGVKVYGDKKPAGKRVGRKRD